MTSLQVKHGGPCFWGKPILQKVWIIRSPLLYFNFKSFKYRTSSSFITFQCLLHDSRVIFSESWNLYKLKRGEPILQYVSIIWSRHLRLNFKGFMDSNYSSFIRFQGILCDSGVLFSEFSNFRKLKRGDLISWGNQFCRKSELFGSPFCISILKVLWTQILCHSLDFNAFCMIPYYFSHSLKISTN